MIINFIVVIKYKKISLALDHLREFPNKILNYITVAYFRVYNN